MSGGLPTPILSPSLTNGLLGELAIWLSDFGPFALCKLFCSSGGWGGWRGAGGGGGRFQLPGKPLCLDISLSVTTLSQVSNLSEELSGPEAG
jgi:hypothetical protein